MKDIVLSSETAAKIQAFRADWTSYYKNISEEKTPMIDGNGEKIIGKRGDGFLYVEEEYIRAKLDQYFPGWSWEMAAPINILGAEWAVAQGHLIIIDEHLMEFGINPPVRRFYGTDAIRIQYGQGKPHTADNIVDVGDACKQACTAALKYAANRMCHIADDVYKKQIQLDNAGTIDSIMESNPSQENFVRWITSHKAITWQEVFKILNVKSLDDITDFAKATVTIKANKKW